MSIYKRGGIYWYKFQFNGKLVRESTKQGNDKVARQIEAAHRTSLAKGEVGIRAKSRVTLADFIRNRFEPWAKAKFEHSSPQTWVSWYRPSLRAMQNYRSLCGRGLTDITSEHIAGLAAHLSSKGLQASSVNARLRVLRRIFHLAVEWGDLETIPTIKLLAGERHREHVISPDEESKYLAAASPLLADVATVLADTGMRPEECFRQCWENVTWVNGRHGTLMVTHGKTNAARRVLPMTPRVRTILEQLWQKAGKPDEGWIWPAPTKSNHIEPSTLRKQHRKALKTSKVRPFVLYTLRHTFLTRLGASGCDVWTLARIAGHSSVAISSRYVHPSADSVLNAMEMLSGHNSGHSTENTPEQEVPQLHQTSTESAA
jgi:integrase